MEKCRSGKGYLARSLGSDLRPARFIDRLGITEGPVAGHPELVGSSLRATSYFGKQLRSLAPGSVRIGQTETSLDV